MLYQFMLFVSLSLIVTAAIYHINKQETHFFAFAIAGLLSISVVAFINGMFDSAAD